jgi:hypothetical protein
MKRAGFVKFVKSGRQGGRQFDEFDKKCPVDFGFLGEREQ